MKSFAGCLASEALARIDGKARPRYLELLDSAFLSAPPHYATQWFGDLFRRRARDPNWVASLLASDSYMEGYSAKRLWQYAELLSDGALAEQMRRHATDEARHSKIFARVVFKTFPLLEGEELRQSLASNTPDFPLEPVYVSDPPVPEQDEVLSSLLLINIFEIKALVLGMLIKPIVVAHAPDRNKAVVEKMLDAIIGDEAHHIRYSADFIERACLDGHCEMVSAGLRDFQEALNKVTEKDLDTDHAVEEQLSTV